jgi:hypothetical protein
MDVQTPKHGQVLYMVTCSSGLSYLSNIQASFSGITHSLSRTICKSNIFFYCVIILSTVQVTTVAGVAQAV